MKTRLYIAALAILTALVSCQRENLELAQTNDGFVQVTFPVRFSSPVVAPTRATWGEGPVNTTEDPFKLYLCVYGAGKGMVQNWIPAHINSLDIDANGYITGGHYTAMLPLADEQRTIHLIANPPAQANPTLTDYMENVMETMVTSDGECSYWQEVILDKITREQSSVQKLIDGVNLVRNFAKIIVETAPSQPFQVLQWTLINFPDKGYVAPYNPNNRYISNPPANAGERFPSAFLNENIIPLASATDGALFLQLSGTGDGQDNYPGYMPGGTALVGDAVRTQEAFDNYPGEPSASNVNYVLAGQPLYMYERPKPVSDPSDPFSSPTAVLAQIQFDDAEADPAPVGEQSPDHTYWYKIEVLDNEGSYVPFYRDIVYRMRIADIEEAGEETAFAAFSGLYFGNISASVETASLTDLSNKNSLIHVDQLDYTFLSGGEEQTLMFNDPEEGERAARFYFIPDTTNPDAKYTTSVDGVCSVTWQVVDVAGFNPSIDVNNVVVEDGAITVTLLDQDPDSDEIKKSIIRVTGTAQGGQAIYRDITINLMAKPSFVGVDNQGVEHETWLETEGVIGVNKAVNVHIWLPRDLGRSLFPLQIKFEAENNTLSATSPDLPVATGVSHFDPSLNTFYYIKTINYDEYCRLNNKKKWEYVLEHVCTFYTNDASDNTTRIRVSELNDRFKPIEYLSLDDSTPIIP